MKAIDLHDIILKGYIDVLKEHGITDVSISGDLIQSVSQECVDAMRQELPSFQEVNNYMQSGKFKPNSVFADIRNFYDALSQIYKGKNK